MQTLAGYDVVRFSPAVPVTAAPTDTGLGTLEVRFSQFGNWYRIASLWEGEFMESIERGAFAKTIQESSSRVQSLFDHGFDPSIGDKVLGTVADLREDATHALGVVDLFDTSYNRDLLPGLEAGVYGASMRMVVVRDEWNDDPGTSAHNPKGLPERTVKEVRLIEFGPVTFGANPAATSSMQRSATDDFYERLRSRDPDRVETVSRARPQTAPLHPTTDAVRDAGTSGDEGAAEPPPTAPAAGHPGGLTHAQRRAVLLNNTPRSKQ